MGLVMTVNELLVRARDRIARYGWTKGYVAENIHGRRVASCDTDAAYWCVGGALIRESGGLKDIVQDAGIAILRAAYPDPVIRERYTLGEFNDARETTRERMLEVMDLAIQNTKER